MYLILMYLKLEKSLTKGACLMNIDDIPSVIVIWESLSNDHSFHCINKFVQKSVHANLELNRMLWQLDKDIEIPLH